MKNIFKAGIFLAVVLFTFTTSVQAHEGVSGFADFKVASSHSRHGVVFVDGTVFIPTVRVGYLSEDHHIGGALSMVASSSDALGYANLASAYLAGTEWTINLDYSYYGFAWVDLVAGFSRINFVKGVMHATTTTNLTRRHKHTDELYVKVATKDVFLNPSTTFAFDIDGANRGWHGSFDISHTYDGYRHPITAFLGLKWAGRMYESFFYNAGTFGPASFYQGRGSARIANWYLGANTNISFPNHFTLTPEVSYTRLTKGQGAMGRSHAAWRALGVRSENDNFKVEVAVNYAF